jgi:hypothetical protein
MAGVSVSPVGSSLEAYVFVRSWDHERERAAEPASRRDLGERT